MDRRGDDRQDCPRRRVYCRARPVGRLDPKALRGYGIADDAWSGDEEMFAQIHAMRCRIIRSPAFTGDKVVGAILFEKTMDGAVDGVAVPQALIAKRVVPFLKIDKGLEDEAGGVQLMKPIPDLDPLLERAKALGMFGTKERSVINRRRSASVSRRSSDSSSKWRARCWPHGMMPILEPEYSIRAADRAEGEVDAARVYPAGARHPAERAASHAQAVAPGRTRTPTPRWSVIRKCSRSSRCRAAIRAPKPAPSWRRTRDDRELQPRAARRFACPDERCGVRRRARPGDRRNLPRVDRLEARRQT